MHFQKYAQHHTCIISPLTTLARLINSWLIYNAYGLSYSYFHSSFEQYLVISLGCRRVPVFVACGSCAHTKILSPAMLSRISVKHTFYVFLILLHNRAKGRNYSTTFTKPRTTLGKGVRCPSEWPQHILQNSSVRSGGVRMDQNATHERPSWVIPQLPRAHSNLFRHTEWFRLQTGTIR